MPKKYKLIAGVSVDHPKGLSASRKATGVAEAYVRQLTWDNAIEASISMWADGTVSVNVNCLDSGKILHEWRRDKDAQD